MNPFYKDYSEYLAELFPGMKVQKISINAGLSCPNRDGTIGTGGCSYCDNSSFSPAYCLEAGNSITGQLEAGKRFFARKYPTMRYLAYFQSFTNTHGRDPRGLRELYLEAARCEDVVGIIVGTRPDTLPDEVIEVLAEINSRIPVMLELGAESSSDETLRRVNRGHTWADTVDTVTRATAAGLRCGLHLIAGLPGEDAVRALGSVRDACALPVDSLKLHQLQIIKGTPLHKEWLAGKTGVRPFSLEAYLDFCVKVVETVPGHIAIERFLAQSPPGMVEAPRWGLKNYQFTLLLLRRLEQNRLRPH